MKLILKMPVGVAALFAITQFALADVAPSDFRQKLSDQVWLEKLRGPTFSEREIIEGAAQNVLELKAPYRAEDATLVPISIQAKIPQTPELHIKKMHIFVDKNPVPLVGIFDFTPASGKADLAMRIRGGRLFLRPRHRRIEHGGTLHGQEFRPRHRRLLRSPAQEH